MSASGDFDSFEPVLFSDDELPPRVAPKRKMKNLDYPIWTENKAKLIERYLLYFVYITKHGTYIDGFSGPQKPEMPDMWAANLVLATEPKWFRNFYLFEKDKTQIQRLHQLKNSQPEFDSKGCRVKRTIEIFEGDFNHSIDLLLSSQCINQKEATFCLLDQRTFECEWESVRRLAAYKTDGNNKIELFYFLPIGWLARALAAQKDMEVLERWWGRNDYTSLRKMTSYGWREAFRTRFEQELGYKSVHPWPIYERHDSRNVMYYMIHATDHPEAPSLMRRAYRKAVQPKESHEQLTMEYGNY